MYHGRRRSPSPTMGGRSRLAVRDERRSGTGGEVFGIFFWGLSLFMALFWDMFWEFSMVFLVIFGFALFLGGLLESKAKDSSRGLAAAAAIWDQRLFVQNLLNDRDCQATG